MPVPTPVMSPWAPPTAKTAATAAMTGTSESAKSGNDEAPAVHTAADVTTVVAR